jgi:hypothetical protein
VQVQVQMKQKPATLNSVLELFDCVFPLFHNNLSANFLT